MTHEEFVAFIKPRALLARAPRIDGPEMQALLLTISVYDQRAAELMFAFAVAGEALGDHVLVNYPEHPEAH